MMFNVFTVLNQKRTFTPASWRNSPLASSIRQASRQQWIAASFFLPVCVTSATSCRPKASSTGSLTGAAVSKGATPDTINGKSSDFLLGHLLYPAQPAATTFVLIFKLQLFS